MTVSLNLSTKVAPAKKFTVDGDEYTLLGIDHLTPDDEATVMALFARHDLLSQELDLTSNVAKGTEVAKRLKACRIQILCKLTDLPTSVATGLPVGGQIRLLDAVKEEMAGTEEDGTAEAGESAEAPPGGAED